MIELWQVDAFCDRPFAGNPAAVAVGDLDIDDGVRQAIASEMNLSETAFVVPAAAADGVASLRWFTPATEVDLCGHATLAAAHVLWNELGHDVDTLRFATRSGELRARRDAAGIVLDFPSLATAEVEAPDGLVDALGVDPVEVHTGGDDLFVVLADASTVTALSPDIAALGRLTVAGRVPRGVIVSAEGGGDADVTSRFFGPAVGVDEDPVTGSAHCVIGPFWARRLGLREIRAHQASARGGAMAVRDRGERVELVGSAVTVARIELLV
jgi:PhzF family phenazine biosynthesis protein